MEAFSNKAEEVIQRSIDVKEGEKCEDVHSYLEIDRCISFVTQNDFKRVALQFPDNLLWTAAQVVAFLSKSTSAKYFILGDTSYGSCCVDEVAANHAEVDCIIHFGRSCLSRTSRLPVLYVFGKQHVDVEDLVEAFKGFFPELSQPVLILYDVIYAHIKDELKERLSSLSDQVIVSMINISVSHPARGHKVTGDGINNAIDENHVKVPTEKTVSETEEPRTREISGRYFTLPEDQSIDNCSCFYIGGAAKHIPMPDTLERETDVSLITGSLRSIRPWDDVGLEDNNRAVVKREEALALVEHKTAGESLSQRSWQGLQPDLGQTPVSDVIEGTRGIAASYTHEEGTPV